MVSGAAGAGFSLSAAFGAVGCADSSSATTALGVFLGRECLAAELLLAVLQGISGQAVLVEPRVLGADLIEQGLDARGAQILLHIGNFHPGKIRQ